MTIITPAIAAPGIAGWSLVPLEDKFDIIFGTKNAVKIRTNSPRKSQIQEKMSSNARAQRRAIMEPIPSHTNDTAKIP